MSVGINTQRTTHTTHWQLVCNAAVATAAAGIATSTYFVFVYRFNKSLYDAPPAYNSEGTGTHWGEWNEVVHERNNIISVPDKGLKRPFSSLSKHRLEYFAEFRMDVRTILKLIMLRSSKTPYDHSGFNGKRLDYLNLSSYTRDSLILTASIHRIDIIVIS